MKKLFIISLIIFIPMIILVSQTEQRLAAENYLRKSEKMISDKSPKITIFPYYGKKIQAVFIKYENDNLFYYDLNTKTELKMTLFTIKQILLQNGVSVFRGDSYKTKLQIILTEDQLMTLKELDETIEYEGKKITRDVYKEKQMAKGLVEYQGNWITEQEMLFQVWKQSVEERFKKQSNPDGEIGVPYLLLTGGVISNNIELDFGELGKTNIDSKNPTISANIIYPATENLTLQIGYTYQGLKIKELGHKQNGTSNIIGISAKIKLGN